MNPNSTIIFLFSVIILLSGFIYFKIILKKEDSAKIIADIVKNPEVLDLLIASEPKLIEAAIRKDPSFIIPIIIEDAKLFEYLMENKYSNLESIIQKKIDKDPNIRLKALKDLSSLYETFLNYKENSESSKKLILKEFANTNYAIGVIYSDVNNKIKDIKGKPFDSFSSKVLLAESYYIKAFDIYSKINDCDYLRISKNNFCNVYSEMEKLSENGLEILKNFKKMINSDLKKCFNVCK